MTHIWASSWELAPTMDRTRKKIRCRWRLRPNFKGQFMRVLYLSHIRAAKAHMSLHTHAVSPPPSLLTLKKKLFRWRFIPNFVHSKAVVLLLLIHSLMFLPLDCGGSVFGSCFVMHYLVFFLVLQSSWRGRESMMSYFNCLPTTYISVLWLFLTVPWVGLKCVSKELPDHYRLHFNGPVHENLVHGLIV